MGSAQQEGGSEGRGLGPGAQQAPRAQVDRESAGPVPFCSFAPLPHHLPQGFPCPRWTPNYGWVPLGVGTPSLPQLPLRGAGPEVRPLLLLPLPSLPATPSGPPAAGGGLGGQRIRPRISAGSWGPKWAGEAWPRSLLILCPPSGPPVSPFKSGIPSPPPAAPQGCQSRPASTSPPPLLPPSPTSYPVPGGSSHPLGVRGPPLVPGRCPSCEETQIPCPPSMPS